MTTGERERWQRDISPYLGKQGHGQSQIISRPIADVGQAEAQRDKLRDKLLEIAKGNCGSFQHDIPTFLAGLSTVTPEGDTPKLDFIYMTRDQVERRDQPCESTCCDDPGHTTGPCTQPCERVSVCCGAPEHPDEESFCAQCREGTGFECSVHEVAWEEGECPATVPPLLTKGLREDGQ